MGRERLPTGEVEMPGQAGDAGENLEGSDVEVGALAPPGGGDAVDIVDVVDPVRLHPVMVRQES